MNIWDHNTIIEKEYEKDNYIVKRKNGGVKCVIIYFSSHDIFYPNTEEVFIRRIKNEDRYEWQNLMNQDVEISIFVRDLHKQWYIEGINNQLNTIDKLIEFLKTKIPDGYKVITIGSSAGGYMAALVGAVLQAEYVIDFSGQNDLMLTRGDRPLVDKYINSDRGKWYNLNSVFEKYGNPQIYYIYSSECDDDVKQFGVIKGRSNIYPFSFKSKKHGRNMYAIARKEFIKLSQKELYRLYERRRGRLISPFLFSIEMVGIIKTALFILNKTVANIAHRN